MDVSVFAVDSLATIPGAIRSGQNEPATYPSTLEKGLAVMVAGSTNVPTACC
jgi:hypothetical protein